MCFPLSQRSHSSIVTAPWRLLDVCMSGKPQPPDHQPHHLAQLPQSLAPPPVAPPSASYTRLLPLKQRTLPPHPLLLNATQLVRG
jgi:hypothetical protein